MAEKPERITARSEAHEFICGMPLSILDAAFDLYGKLDADGAIADVRGRIFEQANSEPSLLVGQRFSDTVFWQSSGATNRLIENTLERAIDGSPCRVRLDFRLGAANLTPFEVSFTPFFENGKLDHIFVFGRSIHQPSEALDEDSKNLLILAADLGGVGLWYWDHKAKQITSTPKCNELFGLAPYDPLTYEKFIAAVHPDDRADIEALFEDTRREGGAYQQEFRVIYTDGTVDWLSAIGRSFIDDASEPEQMVGIVRRITEEVDASLELEQVYELEKKAKNEAEIANRTKDLFLTLVSHELRSPLNAILGWAKILNSRDDLTQETVERAYEIIERSAQVQAKLINDLVDADRVTSGRIKLEFRPINLVDVLRSTFESQRPTAETQEINYAFTSPEDKVVVFGDANRLQQVFANLISNALKFTDSGGNVTVAVAVENSSVKVIVSDDGHGIEPSDLPTIFRQFEQGEGDRSRRRGGLGIGLSIVNILVAKHGGSVTAESEGADRGSRFTVVLPTSVAADIPATQDGSRPDGDAKRLGGLRILIVEDDQDSREVLQIFLEQNGALVVTTEAARNAFQLLSDQGPAIADVIVSDLAMPEEDGYSLISRIRSLAPGDRGTIPAVALSAFVSAESKQKAFDSGFDRYLTKPFEPELLINEILSLRALDHVSGEKVAD